MLISVMYPLDQSAVMKWQSLVLMDTGNSNQLPSMQDWETQGPRKAHVSREILSSQKLFKGQLKRTTESVY